MAKISSVLERQFKKLGIEITDELKTVLEIEGEMPDDVASKIDKGLLTLEAAKTNPEITKSLKQSTLAGADAKMDEIIKEMGLTVGEDFAGEKNTYEKISMLSKMLHEQGKKKGEGNSKESVSDLLKKEREAFAAKEADMQKKLKDLTDGLTSKESEFKNIRESDLTSFELQKILLGKDYVFPKEMDSSLKVQTALGALNKDLAEKGLVIKRNEAGSLVITDKEGQKAYTDKHEPIDSPHSYIDGVLTQNKLLNINDPNAQKQQQGSQGAQTIPGTGAKGNATIVAEIDAQIFK
jgi:polyhydroxyalkanoate synthesis regulator phasin